MFFEMISLTPHSPPPPFHQISFLHVYHHASTFFPCWWSAVNFAPGGDVWFICALNSAVHVLMYGYYLAASAGVKVPAVIKQSITRVQMIQFGLLNAQVRGEKGEGEGTKERVTLV